jgi:hypothetical protein
MDHQNRNPGAVRAAAGARSRKIATHTRAAAPTQYVLRLQSLRGDGIRELRQALKRMLRSFGLRCISIEIEVRR